MKKANPFAIVFLVQVMLAFNCDHAIAQAPLLNTLVNFSGRNGNQPQASLTLGSDNALYGVTTAGGSTGSGIIFKINQDGSGFSVLHNFLGGLSDGNAPAGALVQGKDGALYGTTITGGML